jgi:hypothetical protein
MRWACADTQRKKSDFDPRSEKGIVQGTLDDARNPAGHSKVNVAFWVVSSPSCVTWRPGFHWSATYARQTVGLHTIVMICPKP